MPTFDIAKLLPWIAGALAIAAIFGWFVTHDRAVAREAVAADRAAADREIIDLQKDANAAKQKVIDYADELSKIRLAERDAAIRRAGQYAQALEAVAKDPDVARVLGLVLPESLRQLRRANAAAQGGADGVRLPHAPGVAPTDAAAAAAGPDRRPAAGGIAPVAGGADRLQRGQDEGQAPDRKAAPGRSGWPAFLNPLNWFQPSPRTAP